MASIEQLQKGFARIIDTHISTAFDGWQKAVIAGMSALLAANFPNLVKTYGSHPMVVALGVYDPATGYIDIDGLYNSFVPQLGGEKIPINIPKIGTIKVGKEEFDLLLRYIKEA
jgi:hypothetical protein